MYKRMVNRSHKKNPRSSSGSNRRIKCHKLSLGYIRKKKQTEVFLLLHERLNNSNYIHPSL